MAVAALVPEVAFDVQQAPADLLPAVRALMAKIKVEADERLLAGYPERWPARVRVAAGSTRHARDVTHVPGDPALPFDRARVREKFLHLTQPVLGAETAERILTRSNALVRRPPPRRRGSRRRAAEAESLSFPLAGDSHGALIRGAGF
jgi:2-methylcitrate dehydratase PrpD